VPQFLVPLFFWFAQVSKVVAAFGRGLRRNWTNDLSSMGRNHQRAGVFLWALFDRKPDSTDAPRSCKTRGRHTESPQISHEPHWQ